MNTFGDLFTPRQLTALTVFSDLVSEARQKALEDARSARHPRPEVYADAVATYLAFGVDRIANTLCTIARWTPTREQTVTAFARQALPMTWDFPDVNPFAKAAGDLEISIDSITTVLNILPCQARGVVKQNDATIGQEWKSVVVSTDPPYYDNIGYADLSDFFYIWLRRSLGRIYSNLFPTVLVPKAPELVATPYRFGGDVQRAERFFEDGLRRTFHNIREISIANYPVTVFYAFKQSEDQIEESDAAQPLLENNRASTGWETMLEGLLLSGFEITGTWPMRTELANRSVGLGANALASSIVLVCRPRQPEAAAITRRELLSSLKRELPAALRQLQQGSIAPVDLAQAAIGPGMAVFSRYKQVLEADGSPMRVRTALALINQALDEFLAEQEGEYDADTRWALAWYEQYGFNEGPFGVAETLSKAKNTSVGGLGEAGILLARAGKVRLLKRDELLHAQPGGRGAGGEGFWDPSQDKRPTAWEAVQHLIRALDTHGEQGAALLLSRLGGMGEVARDLAYRLYTICERKGWAQDALGYNMLVVAWPRIKELSGKVPRQDSLL
jgi:putative DNA methylase